MKAKALTLALMLAFAVSADVLAQDAKPVDAARTPEAMAATMWDFTRNPEYLKDPKKFVPWLNAALEPGFYTGLGMQMLDPAMWGVMANSMMSPAAYSAWMPLMTDPNVYMKWLTASMDPNFYNAVFGLFSDTGKITRWAMSPADPKTLGLALQSLNPAMYMKWMLAPLDPRWLQAMITPVNPSAYLGWMGATLNPGSYGDLWKGVLTPTPTPPAPGVAPATTYSPNGTSLANPFDPNVWAKLWQVPGQPALASQTAK
jgi:hypothetical protein